jgi:hypothetical protein
VPCARRRTRPRRSIKYQPDVILIRGGAESIRATSLDGMTDPRVQGASALAVGKIMFSTGSAVGRVLALRHTSDGFAITLGPIELTDIVSHLEFKMDQPIDFKETIEYEAPKLPYSTEPDATPRDTALRPALYSQIESVV